MAIRDIKDIIDIIGKNFTDTNEFIEIDNDDEDFDAEECTDEFQSWLFDVFIEGKSTKPDLDIHSNSDDANALSIVERFASDILDVEYGLDPETELKDAVLIVASNLDWRGRAGYQLLTGVNDVLNIHDAITKGFPHYRLIKTTHPLIVHAHMYSHDVPTGTNCYIIGFYPH